MTVKVVDFKLGKTNGLLTTDVINSRFWLTLSDLIEYDVDTNLVTATATVLYIRDVLKTHTFSIVFDTPYVIPDEDKDEYECTFTEI